MSTRTNTHSASGVTTTPGVIPVVTTGVTADVTTSVAPTPTHAPAIRPRGKRIAKPATSARALAAAHKRRAELEHVLAIRDAEIKRLRLDRPLDRDKLTSTQRTRLAAGPYPAAAATYLATHDKFARAAAHKAEARHVPLDDLMQAAKLGMIRALDKFDTGRVTTGAVTSFLSYARWWVRCEIGKLFETESLVKIPTAAKKAAVDLRAQIAALGGDADDDTSASASTSTLSDDEVAVALSIPVERVRLYRNLHMGHEHQEVLTTGRRRDDPTGAGAALTSRLLEIQAEHDDDAATKQRLDDVEAAMSTLTPLQRHVVATEYGVGGTGGGGAVGVVAGPMSDIARRSILKSALRRLRGAMG